MTFQDGLFLLVLICNLLFVSYLGADIYHESVKLEIAKENGEEILSWVNEFKKNIDTNQLLEQQVCLAKESSSAAHPWKDCLEYLFGPNGKFHTMKNAIKESNPIVAKMCTKGDEATKGAFVFEKVSISSNGIQNIVPIDEGETLTKETMYRLSICDRGNYRILIGEIAL